jgi:hypothetical protein
MYCLENLSCLSCLTCLQQLAPHNDPHLTCTTLLPGGRDSGEAPEHTNSMPPVMCLLKCPLWNTVIIPTNDFSKESIYPSLNSLPLNACIHQRQLHQQYRGTITRHSLLTSPHRYRRLYLTLVTDRHHICHTPIKAHPLQRLVQLRFLQENKCNSKKPLRQ